MFRRRRTIDLQKRIERRYALAGAECFVSRLSELIEPIEFSDCCWAETIYFNTDEHIVPFETSVKARRYIQNHDRPPTLDDATPYLLEIKIGTGDYKRKKRTHTLPLGEILKILPKKYPTAEPLRPYVADIYRRQHYRVKACDDIRITIDTDTSFYYFPTAEKRSLFLGREKIARVEIKEGRPPRHVIDRINAALAACGAVPMVSKKFSAYALLRDYRYRRFLPPVRNEFSDTEFESKLTCLSEQIFSPIKEFFRDTREGFRVFLSCPFTIELSTAHAYYRDENGVYKITVGTRENPRMIRKKEPLGSTSVLAREEIKKDISFAEAATRNTGMLIGQFRKNKRRFLLERVDTGRLYSITLDYCVVNASRLTQLEIEYYGILAEAGSNTLEHRTAIEEDIESIVRLIARRFPQLVPTTITKKHWLERVFTPPRK